jgi:hypothetical protein
MVILPFLSFNLHKVYYRLEDISLSHLPKLPLELWNIVAEYEGGVESSVLGDNNTNTSSWSWCNIL